MMSSKTVNGLLIILLLVFTFNLSGQDKKSFERVFDSELGMRSMNGSKNFKNITQFSYYPDTLPVWFYQPPQSTPDIIYAVGISDPDMEVKEAKELAFHRAKVLACMYSKARLQYYRDVYTSEQQAGKYNSYRQRFDSYFKVTSASLVDKESFSLVDTHFTRFNEYLTLIKFTPSQNPGADKSIISSTGTVLYIEAQVSEAFEVQAEYELLSDIKSSDNFDDKAHYLYREKGNKFLTSSQYQNKIVEFPVYIYRYASPLAKSNTVPLTSYNGLWSKFSQELLRFLTLTTEESRKRIKNLGQQYSPENSNLTREVASLNTHMFMNGIVFAQDTLKIEMTITEDFPPIGK